MCWILGTAAFKGDFVRKFSVKVQGMCVMVILVMLWSSWAGYELSGWGEGYYLEGEECKVCDKSCKTCEGGNSCDSCEDYMYLNSTTGLCQTCLEGEYYDRIGMIWNPWGDICNYSCFYQKKWFLCPEHKKLDIDTFQWVDFWDVGKILIISEQISVGAIWKFPTIYVEPLSYKDIELGTREYPYRSFKSASAEILNYYSHSDKNITMYVKNGYIEMDTMYFLNLTNVKITSHPDYQDMNRRANLIFSTIKQPGISSKARFHILKNDFLNLTSKISSGNFIERELGEISKTKTGFVVARTGFEISNIECYSNELDYFLVPVFFQSKLLKLGEFYFFVRHINFK